MIIFWLLGVSWVGWLLSTLAGGGSPLILIPAVSFLLGASAVPPVITTGMLLGNTQRIFLYWREIDWQLMGWYLPGAVVGSIFGAFVFTQLQFQWLSLLLGVFLVTSTLTYGLTKKVQVFPMRAWYFLPAGFVYAFLSGVIGSTGPLLNPFYLQYGLVKEALIATKSAHVVVVHGVKLIAYAAFGVLTLPYLGYGLVIGIGALPGNLLGQRVLPQMGEKRFRELVIAFVGLSGILLLWEQRAFFTFW